MSKNTVSSEGQLKESSLVRFDNPEGKGVRVMFAGNSMTLHGIRPEVGWYNEWGMAASAKEKDYVHILEEKILEEDPDASFCICQVADWETNYKNGSDKLCLYDAARNFDADIIVLRFIENCKKSDFDGDIFKKELDLLVKHLNSKCRAQIIMTTGFWRHPGDKELINYANSKRIPVVEMGDLGEDDKMKAIGLFSHKGVANHPGDEGMEAMAERIMKVLRHFL